MEKGHIIIFDSEGGKIKDEDGEIIATASEMNDIYKLDRPMKNNAHIYVAEENMGMIWHRRLGHLNRKSMSLLKGISIGLSDNLKNDVPCEECIKGKHAREKKEEYGA